MESKRTCEVCGKELPESDFSKSYKKRCKKCVAEMTKEKRNTGRNVRKTIAYWTERMKECSNHGVEEGHMMGDEILCEILKLTGYGDVVKEFEKLDKWYA